MLVFIAIGGVAAAALIGWFRVLETNGRRHTIFVILASTYIVEAILMPEASGVPFGLFRPRVLGQDFRPVDFVLFAALAVRFLSPLRGRVDRVGLAWTPFVLLYGVGVVVGLAAGLPFAQVLFQGKLLLYLVGGGVVASGADVERLAASAGRVARLLAPLIPLGFLVNLTRSNISVSTPLQRFPTLGLLNNDAVTMLVVIGAAALVVELVSGRPRVSVVIAGAMLMAAPIARNQRASYLTLLACAAALTLILIGPSLRRRSQIGPVHIVLGLATLVAIASVGLAVGSANSIVADAFAGESNAESAEARVSLYEQAVAGISEHILIGSGVGSQVQTVKPHTGDELVTTTHNVLLDLWLRIGLVGLTFFVIAFAATVRVAVRLWRTASSNAAAAIAMGGVLAMLGWLAKAMVEPGLDKFRLSLTLGISVGVVVAASRTASADEPLVSRNERLAVTRAPEQRKPASAITDR